MPTPVEVSHVKRSRMNRSGIERLGDTWRDRPWSMSERNLIAEIERPAEARQWNFFITVDGLQVPIVIVSRTAASTSWPPAHALWGCRASRSKSSAVKSDPARRLMPIRRPVFRQHLCSPRFGLVVAGTNVGECLPLASRTI
jgi:hypothetical protein